jgi:(p)ppGpp synthase/HD superfamily hydrolase
MRLERIIEFIRNAHQGQMRAGNIEPYFSHLERVANSVSHLSESYQIVAYCHDYLEDVEGASLHNLIEMNISSKEIQAIENLTKIKGQSFSDYMERVSSSHLSSVVKASDRADNLLARHPNWSRDRVLAYCNQAEVILSQCQDSAIRSLLSERINIMSKIA